MTESKHSPLPWRAREALKPANGAFDWGIGATINGRELCIAEVFGRISDTVYPNAEANASLIVTAVNMHDELRAAAKEASAIVWSILKPPHDVSVNYSMIEDTLMRLDSVIAKAELAP